MECATRDFDVVIMRIVQNVCELPDRTSPDDQPEMMLVSGEELDAIIRDELVQMFYPTVTADRIDEIGAEVAEGAGLPRSHRDYYRVVFAAKAGARAMLAALGMVGP